MRIGLWVYPKRIEKSHKDFSKLTPKVIIDKNGHKKTVYVRLGLSIQGKMPMGRGENRTEKNDQVQYAGEFVLTRGGSKDFGEISSELAQKIRRQSGKIRLRIGEQTGKPGDYGERHIERKNRLRELNSNGYQNARDFVQDVAGDYDAIYSGDGRRLILYKKMEKKGTSLFIELIPSMEGDFYDVKTGMVTRDTYYKNKKPLWERPQSG
jgi:hypothetical protein